MASKHLSGFSNLVDMAGRSRMAARLLHAFLATI